MLLRSAAATAEGKREDEVTVATTAVPDEDDDEDDDYDDREGSKRSRGRPSVRQRAVGLGRRLLLIVISTLTLLLTALTYSRELLMDPEMQREMLSKFKRWMERRLNNSLSNRAAMSD
jgi:hypothetical protein